MSAVHRTVKNSAMRLAAEADGVLSSELEQPRFFGKSFWVLKVFMHANVLFNSVLLLHNSFLPRDASAERGYESEIARRRDA